MSVWTPHKWVLLISVIMVFTYGLLGLIYVLGVWFRTTPQADVIAILDSDILTVVTLTATLLLLSSLLGLTGTLLNSRPILSFYALLLWPCFISILIVGYMSYKRCAFDLGGKLNEIWSQSLGWETRGTVQSILRCCGWYNPLHEVSFSKTCYARTNLRGCKSKLMSFEKKNLQVYYTYAFGIVPVHIANIFVAMLCSNHVDRLFGKGLMPRKYRLGYFICLFSCD
ncbi:hypothetical protein SISNIDRAFT_411123 [Sistotremastrum niveocremeum HHB9708]|uniref:Tetraspanin Tsp2 n=2 Tax=Sistotremastraceae TaxID=3402574 RepID=A0A164V2C4_9AGAM|nr:hypothetical protein SISNIDRAFT_411123 [Sistotremastrum niveocremeum HHB9708]KZT39918.1 hypothetical protein SISSUDRAFT_984077 [Sistotremastrum suecicum HHB10207 ss-3]